MEFAQTVALPLMTPAFLRMGAAGFLFGTLNLECSMMERQRITVGVLTVITVCLSLPMAAGAQADSLKGQREPLFRREDAYYAAAFAVGTLAFAPFDRRIEQWLQHPETQRNRFLGGTATAFRTVAVPGSTIIGIGLYSVGRVGRYERVADLGLHGLEALLVGNVVTGVIKGTVGRARPYAVADTNANDYQLFRGFRKGVDYSSFPSGHALAGFAAAAAVTSETTRWWPKSTKFVAPVMYGGASLVAASRLYNNKHWASDVVMAAAIGTFSGLKVVKYQHSHPGNRLDRWLLGTHVGSSGDLKLSWHSSF